MSDIAGQSGLGWAIGSLSISSDIGSAKHLVETGFASGHY
jgi:hypothetical protein